MATGSHRGDALNDQVRRAVRHARRVRSAVWQLFAAKRPTRLIAIAAIALCVAGILLFAERLRQEVDNLATANSDSMQWSLAQFEVELLRFETAMLKALTSENADLTPMRMRFDIFYSRYETIANSGQYAPLRLKPEVTERLSLTKRFLDSTAQIMDGDDAQLRVSLSRLVNETDQVEQWVRAISLDGVETFARSADARRQHVARTLARTASLTIALIVILMILVFALLFLVQLARASGRDHAMTANRLESIVTTSLDAILVVNRDGRILEYNGAAERIFGYSRDEAIGRKMDELIIPEHLRDRHHAGMKRYLETNQKRVIGAGRIRMQAMRKGGEIFPTELSVTTAISKEGEIFVSYVSDVSEIVSAQAELVEARDKAIAGENAKANFIAVMSHELRTPLNGLLGALDLLNDASLGIQERKLIDVMKTSGELLLNHVNDVLDISRLEAGMVEKNYRRFDAVKLLSEIGDVETFIAETNGNRILIDASDDSLCDVVGEPKLLKHILLNLVSNAIKFTRNGVIRLQGLRFPGGMVEFSVSDTGLGIPEKEVTHIFDDFVALDARFSRTSTGTGLGLGIARRLTVAMGGTIGVESAEGIGSRFWIRIPLLPWSDYRDVDDEQSLGTAQTPEQEPKSRAELAVLLVEDNSINRFVARRMLEKAGHDVYEAKDGQEAILMANEYPFDLILMDISMPGIDGVQASQEIRDGGGASSNVPIIAITAHALPDDIERFKQAGMNGTLIKPVSQHSLNRQIAAIARAVLDDARWDPVEVADPDIPFDLAVLQAMWGDLGYEAADRLLAHFLDDTERRLAALPADISAAEDAASAVVEIHALAGSAALFGAHRLKARLSALETELKVERNIEWPLLRSELMTSWGQTREAFVQARHPIS
jgi:PAS domain S-box-containing protein